MHVQHTLMTRLISRRWRAIGLVMSALVLAGLVVPLAVAAPNAQTANVLRIGYLGVSGTDTANGAQLAIDQINSVDGFVAGDGVRYQLELVTLDDAPTVESLADDAADLVDQEVVALLGPDDNTLFGSDNDSQLAALGVPVLTAATNGTLTEDDTTDTLFRIRAPEYVYSRALAAYLLDEANLRSIALVQTDVQSTEALLLFEAALTAAGVTPAEKIQLPSGAPLTAPAERLAQADPEVVVMWGPPADASMLLRQLRSRGWNGRFAYRDAEAAARSGELPDDLVSGVLGMDSWSYADGRQVSRIFMRDYVVGFGQVPGPLAAAGYDAIWYLRAVIVSEGVNPDAVRSGLINGAPRSLVQGTLHPIEYANGDLSRIGIVYVLGKYGGPVVIARFDDSQPLALDVPGYEPTPEPTPVIPTNTPGPPTETPFPTATLEGNWARVEANTLNVRTGPGLEYQQIGQVSSGDLFRILGTVIDQSWYVVEYQGGVGWLKAEFITVLGDPATISIIQAPPSPTPAASPTPTVAPFPDIVIATVVLSPTQPVPNKPFTATVMVRNDGGGAAGRFAVAGTFEPGSVYSANFVEGLAAGQTTQIQLSGTLTGTGVFSVAIVADLNKEIQELNEDNNVYNLTYRADYPLLAQQSGVQLNASAQWDLYGGTPDIVWDGFNIGMLNGSKIGILGTTYENAHYDLLSPATVNNTVGLTTNQVNPGVVVGIYTAEGKRAVMRIDNRQGQTIWVTYRVYNDTP